MSGDSTINDAGTSCENQSRRRSAHSANMPRVIPTAVPGPSLAAPSVSMTPKTRFQRENDFTAALHRSGLDEARSSPFVQHIMREIQQTFDRLAIVPDGITSEERQAFKVRCHKFGLYALRRICTAWSLLPSVGSRYNNEVVTPLDYGFAAHSSIKKKNYNSLEWQIAKLIARLVNPQDIDHEVYPLSQKRIDECALAMKKQYLVWQTNMLDEGSFGRYEQDDLVLSEDDVELFSPNYELPNEPSQPTTPAYLMSKMGLIGSKQDEEHHNMHIVATDHNGRQVVLKTAQQKHSNLMDHIAIIRAAEVAERGETAAEANAVKAETSPPARKYVNMSLTKRKRATASDIDPANADNTRTTSSSKNKNEFVKTGSSLSLTDDMDGLHNASMECGNDSTSAQPPKRYATTSEANEAACRTDKRSSPANIDDSGDGLTGNETIAPSTKSLGGKAPVWLRDEDEIGHRIVLDNPRMKMPDVYRTWAALVANTAYQAPDMEIHAFRSDYVPFDRSNSGLTNLASREFDISWRSFQAVKQHLEPFKTWMNKTDQERAQLTAQGRKHCRRVYPENPARNLPKRPPPPRPTFFSDGKTRVPAASRSPAPTSSATAGMPGASSPAILAPSTGNAASRLQDTTLIAGNVWTPINTTSTYIPYQQSETPAKIDPVRRRTRSTIKIQDEANDPDYSWAKDLPSGGSPGPADKEFDDIEGWNTWMSDGEEEDRLVEVDRSYTETTRYNSRRDIKPGDAADLTAKKNYMLNNVFGRPSPTVPGNIPSSSPMTTAGTAARNNGLEHKACGKGQKDE